MDPASSTTRAKPGSSGMIPTLILLLFLVALGVRLSGLEGRSMSHPEMWAPLIPISSEYADPGERSGLPALVFHTITQDTHPPGYYVLLWFWMKLFGSSEWALRTPSVLFGVGAVFLVYWLGARLISRNAGLLAAALLALNGHHVFWSQTARMYSMVCFLGLLATALLIRMEEGSAPRWVRLLYPAVIVAGASSHLFFWGIIAAHIIWTLGAAAVRGTLSHGFAGQTSGAILSSPFLAFAAYQSQNTVAEFSADAVGFWRDYLGFAFLIPTELSTAAYRETIAQRVGPLFTEVATFACAVAGVLLLVVAWRSFDRQPLPDTQRTDLRTPPFAVWGVSALLASAIILGFVLLREQQFARALVSGQYDPASIQNKLGVLQTVKLMVALPFILMACSCIAVYALQRLPRPAGLRWLPSRRTVIAVLAFVPLAVVTVVSWQKPLLNQRSAILFVPYLLLLLGAGLAALRSSRPLLISICAALVVVHAASVWLFWSTRMDPVDFRLFAADLRANLRQGDLLLMRRSWYGTPLLYYLRPGEYNIVVSDFDAKLRAAPQARVWAVHYKGADELEMVLTGRKYAGKVDGGAVYATLHVPAVTDVRLD
jgi:4-amino-4-deoxy-L-arabinose transferase-like glycosyltransferase